MSKTRGKIKRYNINPEIYKMKTGDKLEIIKLKDSPKSWNGKPIKIIKNNSGTFWNANDGTENYSRDIIKLLDYLRLDIPNIRYELKDEMHKNY